MNSGHAYIGNRPARARFFHPEGTSSSNPATGAFLQKDPSSETSLQTLKSQLHNELIRRACGQDVLNLTEQAFDKMEAFHKNEKHPVTGEPIIAHNINCAKHLLEWGFDPKMAAIAFLQDVKILPGDNIPQEITDTIQRFKKASALSSYLRDFSKRGIRHSIELLLLKESSRDVWALVAANEFEGLSYSCDATTPQKEETKASENILIDLAKRSFYKTAAILSAFNLEDIATSLEDAAMFHFAPEKYEEAKQALLEAHKMPPTKAFDELKAICQLISEELAKKKIDFRIKFNLKGLARASQKLAKGDQITDGLRFRAIVNGDKYLCRDVFQTIVQTMNELGCQENFTERKNYIKGLTLEKKKSRYDLGPKDNGYESIQTNFTGTKEERFSIQVRNEEMDYEAEYGKASHFKKKDEQTIEADFHQALTFIERLKKENRRYGIDQDGKIYRLKPMPGKLPLLLDLAFAISPQAGLACPDFVTIKRWNYETCRIETLHHFSVSSPLQNGDQIAVSPQKNNKDQSRGKKRSNVGTLYSKIILNLAGNTPQFDNLLINKRTIETTKRGEIALQQRLDVFKKNAKQRLKQLLSGKDPFFVAYSLERAAKFLGLEDVDGLKLAIALLHTRDKLLDETIAILENSYAAISYKIEGNSIKFNLVCQNHAAVLFNLSEILKNSAIKLTTFKTKSIQKEPSLSQTTIELQSTNPKDPEANLLDILTRLKDLYKGVHSSSPIPKNPQKHTISFSSFGSPQNLLPEVLKAISSSNCAISEIDFNHKESETFFAIVFYTIDSDSNHIYKHISKRLKQMIKKRTIRKFKLE